MTCADWKGKAAMQTHGPVVIGPGGGVRAEDVEPPCRRWRGLCVCGVERKGRRVELGN
jgi:hypothetical protein